MSRFFEVPLRKAPAMSRLVLAAFIAASTLFPIPVQAQIKTLRCDVRWGNGNKSTWELSMNEMQERIVLFIPKTGYTNSMRAVYTPRNIVFVWPIGRVSLNIRIERDTGSVYEALNSSAERYFGSCRPIATPSRLF